MDEAMQTLFMQRFPPEITPDKIFTAFNNSGKGLLGKWKRREIIDKPSSNFDRYYYGAENRPIIHSEIGEFAGPNNVYQSLEPGKMRSGGHGQRNLDYLDKLGKDYTIEYTFRNGVRTGHIKQHKNGGKKSGVGQSWFPDNWTAKDIEEAARYVIQSNRTIYNATMDGIPVFGIYKGVRVGVMKTNGKFSTAFPDNKFQPDASGTLVLNPKF